MSQLRIFPSVFPPQQSVSDLLQPDRLVLHRDDSVLLAIDLDTLRIGRVRIIKRLQQFGDLVWGYLRLCISNFVSPTLKNHTAVSSHLESCRLCPVVLAVDAEQACLVHIAGSNEAVVTLAFGI